MSFHRINALLLRHLYLYKRSLPRLMDLFFWPVLDLLLWGFMSAYLSGLKLANVNIATVLLGAVIFWSLLNQSQHAVATAFLEEVWEKNLLNIFVTPLSVGEFVASTALVGLIRIFLVSAVTGVCAFLLYRFDLLRFGLLLVPFLFNLLLFGWSLGIFVTAIILRYGTSAQVLAFGIVFLVQPFSAVFYPVSVLPPLARSVAYLLPSTYVFEGMRAAVGAGAISFSDLLLSVGLNAALALAVLWYFYYMLRGVKARGRLLKLD